MREGGATRETRVRLDIYRLASMFLETREQYRSIDRSSEQYLLRAVRGVSTIGAAAVAVLGGVARGVAEAPSNDHGTAGSLNPVRT